MGHWVEHLFVISCLVTATNSFFRSYLLFKFLQVILSFLCILFCVLINYVCFNVVIAPPCFLNLISRFQTGSDRQHPTTNGGTGRRGPFFFYLSLPSGATRYRLPSRLSTLYQPTTSQYSWIIIKKSVN